MICWRRRSPRGCRLCSSAPAFSPYGAPRRRGDRGCSCRSSARLAMGSLDPELGARRQKPPIPRSGLCRGTDTRSPRSEGSGSRRAPDRTVAAMGRRVTCLLGDWTDRYPLRRAGKFLIVLKNHILVTSECEYGGSELTDVKALVDALTLEEKAALTAGEDMLSTVAVERIGIPKVHVTDGPSGARGNSLPGHGWCALDLHPVRIRTRGNLEPGARPRRSAPSSGGRRVTVAVGDCSRPR